MVRRLGVQYTYSTYYKYIWEGKERKECRKERANKRIDGWTNKPNQIQTNPMKQTKHTNFKQNQIQTNQIQTNQTKKFWRVQGNLNQSAIETWRKSCHRLFPLAHQLFIKGPPKSPCQLIYLKLFFLARELSIKT